MEFCGIKYNEVIYVFLENESTTAYMCAFVKAHHMRTNLFKIYEDRLCEKLLFDKYDMIKGSIEQGADFFEKGAGADKVINSYLAGNVIVRTAFNLNRLNNAVLLNTRQYVNLASGLDVTGYEKGSLCRSVKIFDLDRYSMLKSKKEMLKNIEANTYSIVFIPCDLACDNIVASLIMKGFCISEKSYFAMFGITQYLSHKEFESLLHSVSLLSCKGTALAFDYQSIRDKKINALANGTGEEMKADYSDEYVFETLRKNGFRIYELMNSNDIEQTYFERYNQIYPEKKMKLQGDLNLVLAVKS